MKQNTKCANKGQWIAKQRLTQLFAQVGGCPTERPLPPVSGVHRKTREHLHWIELASDISLGVACNTRGRIFKATLQKYLHPL